MGEDDLASFCLRSCAASEHLRSLSESSNAYAHQAHLRGIEIQKLLSP